MDAGPDDDADAAESSNADLTDATEEGISSILLHPSPQKLVTASRDSQVGHRQIGAISIPQEAAVGSLRGFESEDEDSDSVVIVEPNNVVAVPHSMLPSKSPRVFREDNLKRMTDLMDEIGRTMSNDCLSTQKVDIGVFSAKGKRINRRLLRMAPQYETMKRLGTETEEDRTVYQKVRRQMQQWFSEVLQDSRTILDEKLVYISGDTELEEDEALLRRRAVLDIYTTIIPRLVAVLCAAISCYDGNGNMSEPHLDEISKIIALIDEFRGKARAEHSSRQPRKPYRLLQPIQRLGPFMCRMKEYCLSELERRARVQKAQDRRKRAQDAQNGALLYRRSGSGGNAQQDGTMFRRSTQHRRQLVKQIPPKETVQEKHLNLLASRAKKHRDAEDAYAKANLHARQLRKYEAQKQAAQVSVNTVDDLSAASDVHAIERVSMFGKIKGLHHKSDEPASWSIDETRILLKALEKHTGK